MAARRSQRAAVGNRILDLLPTESRKQIVARCRVHQGDRKEVLQALGGRIDDVFFPVDAVVSVLTTLSDGSGVEIVTVGNEGMVGATAALGATAVAPRQFSQVQVPGRLLQMSRRAFVESLTVDDGLRTLTHRYLLARFALVAQQVACNAVHSVEQRCSRWLLLTRDRVRADTFPITQEFLAQMLGVRRASVTVAAHSLQQAGLIDYRRGQLTVVDGAGLEAVACECYRVSVADVERFLPAPPRRDAVSR